MSATSESMGLGLYLLTAGMAVVFTALVALMLALKVIRRFGEPRPARQQTPVAMAVEPEVSGVLLAALATVLVLDEQRVEEDEKLVLTLRALPKPYSNWWQSRLARAPWDPRYTPSRPEVWQGPRGSGKGQS